ncbi:methylated-DNA--[protein]-cysteine S-methyltransferase [Acinetobacter stercoris]|uniref:Methylated-DNA--protein-cysteine methyltransferase n=1 Tax=Acinetobacter stercoris TaxID=2126983 RepID=A0A2U3MXG1_9GAMM|nr:methylated-DNA--[protein]-cysteine S-methyltransferase [Acinetobacter stercoris]SPL70053.1 Methylated-DNA-protein-cysteine methyltransferase, constitutive [Acinetobacter stercoris]
MQLYCMNMDSPVGMLKLVAHDHALLAVIWENENPDRVPLNIMLDQVEHPILSQARQQLTEYFAQERQHFELPLELNGTDFQKKVWSALLKIPYGETRRYKDIAVEIGHEKAVRAVGAANGKNPISIIVPCHRIVGTNGSLTGFAGGLENKSYLLALESKLNKS